MYFWEEENSTQKERVTCKKEERVKKLVNTWLNLSFPVRWGSNSDQLIHLEAKDNTDRN